LCRTVSIRCLIFRFLGGRHPPLSSLRDISKS
jgi:hypothetical protein